MVVDDTGCFGFGGVRAMTQGNVCRDSASSTLIHWSTPFRLFYNVRLDVVDLICFFLMIEQQCAAPRHDGAIA
jgi:hypothetical protein